MRAGDKPTVDRQLERLLAAQERTPGLFRDQPHAMVLYDLSGRIVLGNAAAVGLLGHPPGTLIGSTFAAHLAPECVAGARRVAGLAAQGCSSDFEAVFVHADGRAVNATTTVIPARLDDEIVGFYGIVRDVRLEQEVAAAVEHAERLRSLYLIAAASGKTAAQQIDETLRLGTQLLAVESGVIMQHRAAGVTATHSVGALPMTSLQALSLDEAAWRRLFGRYDVLAVDDVERPPEDREPLRSAWPWRSYIATPFEIGGSFAGIVVFGARQARGALFSNADREFVRLISSIIGSTLERQSAQERLDALAFSDPLTGLPNRALLQDRLGQLIAESRRNAESFAVHFLDLDGFKDVNDTAGHARGDYVLREAAKRLKDALRESDSVARLGGDEFVILQKHVRAPAEAVALATTLLDVMRLPFADDSGAHQLSASIGISSFPGDGDTPNTLLQHADVALYRAKSLGRNRVAVYRGEDAAPVTLSLVPERV